MIPHGFLIMYNSLIPLRPYNSLVFCIVVYINYKKFCHDKILDKYFDENFFDEILAETKFCCKEIFLLLRILRICIEKL